MALLVIATAGEPAPTVKERRREVDVLIRATKYEEAIALARTVLAETETTFGADSQETAEALTALYTSLSHAGKAGQGEGLQLAQRALAIRRAGEDLRALGESLLAVGTCQWRIGDYESARSTLKESIEVYTRALGVDDLDRASAIENLGILDWTLGDFAAARAGIEETLRIREAKLDPMDDRIGRTMNNLAIVHYKMGDYSLARQRYERSLQIREKARGRNHPDTADVIENLAMVLRQQGEYAEARPLYEEALAIRERTLGPGHPQVATSLINTGVLLYREGELDRALEAQLRALAIFEKAYGENHWRFDLALVDIAWTLTGLERYDEAQSFAERALDLRTQLAPNDARVAVALDLLAFIHEAREDLDTALQLRTRAVEVTERALGGEHHDVAGRLAALAFFQMRHGALGEAETNLGRALGIDESVLGPDHPDVAEILAALAEVHWRQGHLERARDEARRAGEIQDAALRSTLQALSEQHALYMASRLYRPEAVLFSGLVAGGEGAIDWLVPCWEWTLRRHGLVFDELARRQRAALSSRTPGRLAAWERLSEARRQLAALWIRGPGDGDSRVYRTLLSGATEAKKSAEADLARLTPGGRPDAPIGRSDVQRAIPKGGVLVEVVRTEVAPPRSKDRKRQDIALVLFDSGRTDFVSLGDADRIDALVEDWRRALETGMDRIASGGTGPEVLEDAERAGVALRRAVWDPIAARIGIASPVFLVPDGALHRVDLRALPAIGGGYLAESKTSVHLLSSGRDLLRFTGVAERSGAGGLLALGHPDFGAAPGERLLAAGRFRGVPPECRRIAERSWAPLPQSGLEVKEIAALAPKGLPVRVATGDAASEELFRREAPGRSTLHLATHGFFASEECAEALAAGARDAPIQSLDAKVEEGNPLLLSGLVLAGAGRKDAAAEDDGVLTAEEIAGLDLAGVRLAVLSACDTGEGRIAVGEGISGLRRALEIAGVRTVLTSQWRIPDREARRWMKSFYGRLFDGTPAWEAARRASLDALRRLRDRDEPTHPYLWAGFVTAGDWH